MNTNLPQASADAAMRFAAAARDLNSLAEEFETAVAAAREGIRPVLDALQLLAPIDLNGGI
ncbi:MAG: hypothetical protein K0Q52_203 [Microbacterium sp.]|jgi:hypothetical protein|nr:hypothetical protein [Microbacterium sp.]